MLPPLVDEAFPGSSDGKEFACNAGDLGLIPGFGRSPGEGNVNLLQYLCLQNSMDMYIVTRTMEPGGLQSMSYQRIRND